jgi:hypothetical protein
MEDRLIFLYRRVASYRWRDAGGNGIALTDVRTSLRVACRKIRMRKPGGDVEPQGEVPGLTAEKIF